MAPVGQTAMHPPQSSQEESMSEIWSEVEIVVSDPRPVSVMALTPSTSSQ
jgi:hypothetical protein